MEPLWIALGFCLDLMEPILPKDMASELPLWLQWAIVGGLAATLIWVIVETFG